MSRYICFFSLLCSCLSLTGLSAKPPAGIDLTPKSKRVWVKEEQKQAREEPVQDQQPQEIALDHEETKKPQPKKIRMERLKPVEYVESPPPSNHIPSPQPQYIYDPCQPQPVCEVYDPCRKGLRIALRGAGFVPEADVMRQIYGSVLFEGQVEGSMVINKDIALWTNVGLSTARGNSIGLNDKTRVWLVPITFGAKYFLPCNIGGFTPYIGLGFGAIWARFRDKSDFVQGDLVGAGAAMLAKSGLEADLGCGYYLDIFADYGRNWLRFGLGDKLVEMPNTQTGGVKFGAGIGCHF